jgi:hypothetical protein
MLEGAHGNVAGWGTMLHDGKVAGLNSVVTGLFQFT